MTPLIAPKESKAPLNSISTVETPVVEGKVDTKSKALQKSTVRRKSVMSTPSFSALKTLKRTSPRSLATSAAKEKSSKPSLVYDEDWITKQSANFKNWMNFMLNPAHEMLLENDDNLQTLFSPDGTSDSFSTAPNRYTFRKILLHRQWGQARQKAFDLYNTDEMISLRVMIQSQATKERIAMRADRDVLADVSLRRFMVDLFLSYEPLWLKLALETMFGVNISFDKKAKTVLRHFIVERVLGDPDTMMKFTGGKYKVLSGSFEKKYRAELRKKTLYHILLLIAFLDRLKVNNLFDTNPPLFIKDLKSSNEVLILICKECLSGEGNIIKHLSRLGLKVFYEQQPIDNYDFTVTNLAVDLRDGVRLARIIEILQGDKHFSLSQNMRLPAISRLQKLHNVDVALNALMVAGVPNLNDISASHVVDGHCQRALKLIWSTVAHFKLSSLLNPSTLKQEIQDVYRANKRRSKKSFARRKFGTGDEKQSSSFDDPSIVYADQNTSLLLQWCQAVCSCFGFHVENFTTSFADGKALCYLVHYYHPGILTKSEILPTSRDEIQLNEYSTNSEEEKREQVLRNERHNSATANKRMTEIGGIPNMLPVTDTMNIPEEKSMIICLTYLCSRLIESSEEIQATLVIQSCYRRYHNIVWTEKKMVAASFIFRCWKQRKNDYIVAKRRKYGNAVKVIETFILKNQDILRKMKRIRIEYEKKNNIVTKLQAQWKMRRCRDKWTSYLRKVVFVQRIVRGFLSRLHVASMKFQLQRETEEKMVIKIQSFLRRQQKKNSHRINLQFSAATMIQKIWRAKCARIEFQIACLAGDILQSYGRCVIQRNRFLALKKEIIKIQAIQRGITSRQAILRTKRRAQELERSVGIIQRHWRGSRTRSEYKKKIYNVVQIQSIVRAYQDRSSFQKMKYASILLQNCYRTYKQTLREKENIASVLIQASIRGMLVRSKLELDHFAAAEIQRIWLGHKVRLGYMEMNLWAIIIQRAVRRYNATSKYIKMQHCSVTIQKCIRGAQAREELELRRVTANMMKETQRIAASIIQNRYRSWKLNITEKERNAATLVQKTFRGMMVRLEVQLEHFAATEIQRIWCGHVARKEYAYAIKSVRCIQRSGRRYIAVKKYNKIRQSAITIQKVARGAQAREDLELKFIAASVIQEYWRQYITNIYMKKTLFCIITAQSVIRMYLKKLSFANKKIAASIIQNRYRSWKLNITEKERNAATLVQKTFRGMMVRLEVQLEHFAATEIQRIWCGHVARKEYAYAIKSVRCIQRSGRRYIAYIKAKEKKLIQYRLRVESSILLQSVVRRYIAQKRIVINHFAASLIQRMWRGYKIHVEFIITVISVVKIQAAVRGKLAFQNFRKAEKGVLALQSRWRGITAMRYVAELNYCAMEIQRVWQGSRVRDMMKIWTQAAIIIQSGIRQFRHKIAMKKLKEAENATIQIQRMWRGYRINVEYIILLLSTIKLQSALRGFLVRKNLQTTNHSATMLQSLFRGYSLRKKLFHCRTKQIELFCRNRAARTIQNATRSFFYVKKIMYRICTAQRFIRGFLARSKLNKMKTGFTSLQSVYRGAIIRSRCSQEVRQIARKVSKANKNAALRPEMILGERTARALAILSKSSRLSNMMKATMMLEISTRLSKKCCFEFCKANASNILYDLMRTCNRSLPHIELLQYVMLTLLNVAKHNEVIPSISSHDAVEILIDMIQMFRDKEHIFNMATQLLSIVCYSHDQLLVS